MVAMNRLICVTLTLAQGRKAEAENGRNRPNQSRISLIRFLALALFACLFLRGGAYAQTFPPAWINTSHYAAGDLVTEYGNYYRCIAPVTKPFQDPSKFYSEWELYYVRNNTTVVIGPGQPFPNLQTAWKYILNCSIGHGVYLHLSISTQNGSMSESFPSSFSLDHPFGADISIIGDQPDAIVLGGASGFSGNGLTIDSGHGFGVIANVTIFGQGNANGISLTNNANIGNITGVVVDKFVNGVNAAFGASVNMATNNTFEQMGNANAQATNNANICIASGWTCTASTGACGVSATDGGQIAAEGTTFTGGNSAIYASNGGNVDAGLSTFTSCGIAVFVVQHGYADVHSSTFSGNTYDLYVELNGVIYANSTGMTTTLNNGDGSQIMY